MELNLTSAVFLINDQVRAIKCTYEPGERQPDYIFKTLDKTIRVDDYVVIPTDTRHGMTVAKVSAVDVEVDMESNVQLKWIVSGVDKPTYDEILAMEKDAIDKIREARALQKREELKASLKFLETDNIKKLAISHKTGDVA